LTGQGSETIAEVNPHPPVARRHGNLGHRKITVDRGKAENSSNGRIPSTQWLTHLNAFLPGDDAAWHAKLAPGKGLEKLGGNRPVKVFPGVAGDLERNLTDNVNFHVQ